VTSPNPHPSPSPAPATPDSVRAAALKPDASDVERPATIRRLKWIALAAAVAFVLVLESARHALFPYLSGWGANLLLDAFVFVSTLFLLGGVFDVIERFHSQLERKNRELAALRQAGLLIFSELSEEVVLQVVVDQARMLIATKYGALSVMNEHGGIVAFITSGIEAHQRQAIGTPPVGKGLLGIPLHQGKPLRVGELSHHPESAGFPANHPAMKSLLAVPIPSKPPFRGNLYLCDKLDGGAFDRNDEESLERFAVSAAIAIDNAEMHRRSGELAVAEERLRLAHEMHDGMAQVLAYVNTKAQAVQGYLRNGRVEEADAQLDQLSAAAREVYSDVREGIVGLRLAANPDLDFGAALATFVEKWETETGIDATFVAEGAPILTPGAELQLRRMTQEALANARKHSRASLVQVSLRQLPSGLELRVADDGAGFDPSIPARGEFPHFGLLTIRERAESIGATVELRTAPGQGTQWTFRLPTSSDAREAS
jgi:signal transduction histidine kinase